jgi:putative transcription antitermination factor YqgF
MSKYLGIDYGLAHIGLATSESTLATPLESLKNNENLLSNLSRIIKEEGITKIVCGIPEGKLVDEIKRFAAKLSELTGIEVILHQETLSSQDAVRLLNEAGASRAKKQNDHAYAACLILEDYLELHGSSDLA